MTKYRAQLIQGKGWHVVGAGVSISVTAKTIAVAMARQMSYDAKRMGN